ncbi:MAG: serine hydrolase [Bacteroidales bacterium]|nr:serine hydrolase [Bacteroidales bacterium]
MKFLSLLTFIAGLSIVFCQCQTSTEEIKNDNLSNKVIKSINRRISEEVTPSMAIAIIKKSGIQYFNFGKTEKNGSNVDENTIYEIGSISKVFTAVLLAQQVLDGDLTLHDNINDYLPDYVKVPVMGNNEITFGNLTDHTSGLPRMPDNFTPANQNNPYADYTVNQMYEFISNYKPVRSVGDAYEYSNLGQGLLGHILAMNKNATYEQLMIQTIAQPLELNDTKIEFNERMKANLALGHSGGKVVENWDIPTLAGAGAIRSSTSDMAKFISANLGYLKSPLLPVLALTHKLRHNKAGEMSVAMGWHIKKGKEGDVYWHNGGTGGYRTFVGFVKETGMGVVILTNSNRGADDIGFHLLDSSSELAEVKSKNEVVEIPEATLEKYVGVYEIQPDLKLTITKESLQLFGQATGQEKFEMFPKDASTFFLTIVEAEISFHMHKGIVESLILSEGGQEIKGKKVEY